MTVRVRDAIVGDPIVDAWVAVFDPDETFLTSTDATGSAYVLRGRRYQLRVTHDGYGTAVRDVEVGMDGQTVNVALDLAATAKLRVTSAGVPVAEFRARVVDEQGRELRSRRWGLNGRATFTDLPAGTLRVEVTTDDGRKGGATVTTRAGETTDVKVDLR